jgi:prophage regulatory protein
LLGIFRKDITVQTDILIPIKEVVKQTSLSKVTIWRGIKKGTFPNNRRISEGRVAWVQSEISSWIADKMGEAA